VVVPEMTPPLPPPYIRDDASFLLMIEFNVMILHKSLVNCKIRRLSSEDNTIIIKMKSDPFNVD